MKKLYGAAGILASCIFGLMVLSVLSPQDTKPPLFSERSVEDDFEGIVLYFAEFREAGERQVFNTDVEQLLRKRFPHIRLVNGISAGTEEEWVSRFQSAEQRPHLIVTAHPDMWMDRGLLAGLDQSDIGPFDPPYYQKDGQRYGVHAFYDVFALYYNEDLFDEAGLSYPEEGMGWEEIYAITRLMSRPLGEAPVRGMHISLRHACRPFDLSDNIISVDKVVLGQGWRDCLEHVSYLYRIPGNAFLETELARDAELFLGGRLAMRAGPIIPALHQEEQGVAPFRWGMISYPDTPAFGSPATNHIVAVTESSPFMKEALQVMEVLLAPEVQLRAIPSSQQLDEGIVQATLGLADVNSIIRDKEERLWLRELRRESW